MSMLPKQPQPDFADEEDTITDMPRQLVLQTGPVASPAYMAKIVEAARIERQKRLGPTAPK